MFAGVSPPFNLPTLLRLSAIRSSCELLFLPADRAFLHISPTVFSPLCRCRDEPNFAASQNPPHTP
ncbi:hypothetical protein KCP78_23050 [Salmonella enterica subsp. enterica]|nr:hypothetical protein KCP78_23050 [Salmonella enterica subsp. enterica]